MRAPCLFLAAVSMVGCGGRAAATPLRGTDEPASWSCAARIPYTYAIVTDTPGGARVLYRSMVQQHAQALQRAVERQFLLPRARAAGGAPLVATLPLPPASTTIQPVPSGASVWFEADEPGDVPRLRQLLRWDANRHAQGLCSVLRVTPP